LHACCLKTGQEWIPTSLIITARIALLQNQADDVLGKDYADRIDMCKCTVASTKGATSWRGTITHVETWRPQDAVVVRGTRTTTNSASQEYKATLELTEERGAGVMVAFERATGSWKSVMDDIWQPCSPTLHSEDYLEGRYADEDIVKIRTWPDGRYSLEYLAQPAEGRTTGRRKSTLVGNCNPFFLKSANYDKEATPQRGYVTARGNRPIQAVRVGGGDPNRFKDTFDTEVPYVARGVSGPIQVHVEWDLTRCGKR
jgi:hypothetical protein